MPIDLRTALPQTSIPVGQYREASGAAFAQVAQEAERGAQKVEGIANQALAARRAAEDAKKLVQVQQDAAEIKSQVETELDDTLRSLRFETDPKKHAEAYQAAVERIQSTLPERATYPETAGLLRRSLAPVYSQYQRKAAERQDAIFIDARKASLRNTLDNYARLAAGTPITPEGDAEFADHYQSGLAAIRAAEPVIGGDHAEVQREALRQRLFGLRAQQDEARDPEGFLDRMNAGRYAGMKPEQDERLRAQAGASIIRRDEKAEAERKRIFNEQSGMILKDLVTRARTGNDVQDAVLDNAAVMTPEHFREALTINDSMKKARNVGETNERTLTTVRELINTRQIKTPAGLAPYAGKLSEPDYQRQLDRIAELQHQDRTEARVLGNEAKTDAEKKQAEATRQGREYIIASTQVGPQLITFDAVAQTVRAEQVNRFETESRGKTPAEIDLLAKARVAEARVVLHDQLRINGERLYPLLGQYRTEADIAAGFKAGKLDQQTADNMIHLVRYLDRLGGAAGAKAEENLVGGVMEGVKKPKETGVGRAFRAITGQSTPGVPTKDELAPLVKAAAEDLYPGVRYIELLRDEAKVEAIRKAALERFQKGQRKP